MSVISSPTRRNLLTLAATAGAMSLFPASLRATTEGDAIRPFTVNFPEADLADLRNRVKATRWPDRETVKDTSQGAQLATMQALARYWATEHDWRKIEAKLNALPQFVTEIDGLDIHFIHVRSKHENALPMIVTHGWPGSIIEQLKIIDPLTNPTAHGGSASDAFDLVIPSLPGYGFSGKPTAPGWTPVTIARAWATLMRRLGYTRYVAQGGDWGNAVSEVMALQQPAGLLGIHTNMAATVPADVSKALSAGSLQPAGLSADEKHAWDQLDDFYKHGLAYAQEMSNRPQTLYGIVDSPVGLAAWMLDHDIRSYGMISRAFDGKTEGLNSGRHPRQRYALLVDQHGDLLGAPLLGHHADFDGWRLFRRQGSEDSGRRERLPRRNLCCSEKLGSTGLSQTHPLQ